MGRPSVDKRWGAHFINIEDSQVILCLISGTGWTYGGFLEDATKIFPEG